jgi:hypothetical protein
MNIAILMMQKNEDELLSKWITYHSCLVGRKNLFLFDNGSTDAHVVNQLVEYQQRGINVIWDKNTKEDYENRGNIFCDFIQELDKKDMYDYYMLIDCDEFLAVVDDEGNICCESKALKYSLLKYQNNDELLMIDSQYYNSSISSIWFNKQPYRKCFFKKNTIKQLDQGFHWGKVKTSQQEVRTNLVHIHFHNKPYSVAKEHAREKLTGRVKDFNIPTLREYKGSGFHLVRFFLETEQEYIKGQIHLNHIKSESLKHKFHELNILWPFSDYILGSRKSLGLIDEDSGFKKVLPKFRGSIDSIIFEDNLIKIKGWGLINHSRPVNCIFLTFANGENAEFLITNRMMREDVNNMLNVKGVKLGFTAELAESVLDGINSDIPEITTFLDSNQFFYNFDMHRKFKNFDFFNQNNLNIQS